VHHSPSITSSARWLYTLADFLPDVQVAYHHCIASPIAEDSSYEKIILSFKTAIYNILLFAGVGI
jgi:hypothetical protein